ncbi:hypothetical protein PG989_002579 [Apiospora arundinis]
MSSTALQKPLTPTKPSSAPPQDSPGTWRHPRLQEIAKRQNATTFGEKNVKKVVYNVVALVAMFALHGLVAKWISPVPLAVSQFATYVYRIAQLIPLYNMAVACMPLVRSQDDMSDIALTPGQRQLLGLPPSSNPPSPGSTYSTPPRYSRTPLHVRLNKRQAELLGLARQWTDEPILFPQPLGFRWKCQY